jgi:chromosome segregation ATPase
MKKEELRDLIDSLELYLKLINSDLPELREENRKTSSNLHQLVIESRKVTNIGTLLIELKETFADIQKRLSANESLSRRIELIVNEHDTLKNRLNIIYALLFGFFLGYAINIFLPF